LKRPKLPNGPAEERVRNNFPVLDLALEYEPAVTAAFDPDWRSAMLPHWRKQATRVNRLSM
jgi:hypothetical protein